MTVAQQQQKSQTEEVPRTLTETLEQVSEALDRESESCLLVAEKRRATNPGSANGFYKRGMFINRQFKNTQRAIVRVTAISDIMTAAYSVKADAEGNIDLSKLTLPEESTKLLKNVQTHAVIPDVIHVLSLGSLYRALMQYPM